VEVSPYKPTVRGPDDWVTGQVWIDAVAEGHATSPMTVGWVHFTPGARTAWHRHSLGQTLQISEGEGRVQSRGQDIVTVRPGDIVVTPGDEWHWHGAAPDRFMTHLSVTEGDTEWGDHATHAEYQGQ